jgi:hypothetical protein
MRCPVSRWACVPGEGSVGRGRTVQRALPDPWGLSAGPRTQEGRDRLSAATKKMWAEHREERRALISAGLRRYWKRRREEQVSPARLGRLKARLHLHD